MTPQIPQQQPVETFEATLQHTLTNLVRYRQTYEHALKLGITPRDIVRYARCELPPAQREEVEAQLVRSPWALGRVAALVKAGRDQTSTRYRAATVPILNEYAREEPWEDEAVEGCKLLDTL